MSDVLLVETADGVRTLTLNRPEARNALSSELQRVLAEALWAADEDEEVAVVVLTGTDPAFCAGLDLRELGSTAGNLRGAGDDARSSPWGALWKGTKPVVGAVNGPAVTGGLELALSCDFLVASERATFADTHARVGLSPGGGMSVLLPQAVGLRKAREMSLTGNYLSAREALSFGLVNHVVAHEELLPTARRIAADVAGNDQRAVRHLKALYDRGWKVTGAEAVELELEHFRNWSFEPAEIERRRAGIVERGRSQTG
ncbi:MAG: enoyl-CoA hydratase [Acidimicrobiia bacterium]|nr:enoyl-CoA hydratase [Acidimicrobiia bacterium]